MLSLVVHWGDMARWLVILAPFLIGGVALRLLQRRRTTRPWGRPVRSGRYSLRKLAAVLVIVLIGDATARLGGMILPVSAVVGNFGFFVAMVMFLVWFYRARVNAEGHGWPQRLSPGWGTRGLWIRLRGPKWLIVGTDAFMVSAPQALSEFVFRGSESSIAFGQAVNPDDCIMITGQAGGRQVQLAITGGNLPDIWQALAGTGAAFVLRVVNSESFSGACWNPQLWRTWSSPSARRRRILASGCRV